MNRITRSASACRALTAAALLGASAAAVAAPAVDPIIPLPIKTFIPEANRTCAERLPSGLGYTQLRPGTGAKPGATDFVLINYVGYLAADGLVFDSSQHAAFALDQVVPGFGSGVAQMTKGSIFRLCVPAALGYGAQGGGPVPPGADLVFQVELIDFKSKAEVEAMRAKAGEGGDPSSADPAAPAQPVPATKP